MGDAFAAKLRSDNDRRVQVRRWDRYLGGVLTRLYARWTQGCAVSFANGGPYWGDPTIGDMLTLATAEELRVIDVAMVYYEDLRWLFPDASV